MSQEIILEAKNINKSFSGIPVLRDVHLDVRKGEVHALMGENGAGKSTLIKIITGAYTKDSGQLLWKGEEVEINSLKDCQALGMSCIYQELSVIPALTVAQNIYLGREPKIGKTGLIDYKKMNKMAQDLIDQYEFPLNARDTVDSLGIGLRQLVEILKGLSCDSELLIMDEPTASLSGKEATILFSIIHKLRDQGVSIIYISHRLEEIMQIGDHITILRDGKYVSDAEVKDIDVPWIVHEMTGGAKSYPKRETKIDWSKTEKVLEVKGLCLPKAGGGYLVDHVNFDLHKGEILGIYGLMGAGRSEIFECLMGMHPEHTGEVFLEGEKLDIKSISGQIDKGFALIPEDRQAQGLVQTMDIEKNCSLSAMKRYKKAGIFLDKTKEGQKVDEQIKDIHIKVADKHLPILSLSGGNQQKVVIGKGILTEPKILLMDEPSRGIDIGAKTEVFDIINQYAERGLSIIVVSSELQEIVSIADRVLVLSNGLKTGEFSGDEIQEDTLVLASYKGHHAQK